MKAKAYFLDEKTVKVETGQGEVFILGFNCSMNYQIDKKVEWSFTDDLVAPLFDKYYDGDPNVIMGVISAKMIQNQCNSIFWFSGESNADKVRIGARIKQLRQEKNIEAKQLADIAGIDAANLCRIEQGKYSVGLQVLSKITNALDCKVDIVPNNKLNE